MYWVLSTDSYFFRLYWFILRCRLRREVPRISDAREMFHCTLSSTRFGVPLTAAGYVAGLMAAAFYLGYVVHRALVGFGHARSEGAAKRIARAVAFAAFCWLVLGLTAVIQAATGTLLPF